MGYATYNKKKDCGGFMLIEPLAVALKNPSTDSELTGPIAISRKRGFTLVELLVVIAVIGLLTAIVMVSLTQSKAKSRDAKRAADVQEIAQALALYHNTYQQYPCSASGCVDSEVVISGSDNLSISLRAEKFISAVPLDPLNNATYKFWYRSAGPDYAIRYCQETNSLQRLTQDCNNIITP